MLIPSIVPAARSHRESVACGTPTSFESAVADTAAGPLIRCTIFRLNFSEYTCISSSLPPPVR
ncbi:MAG: hypothetical protein ACK6DV_03070, partial [Deltaproteobacteria bacterium]